MKRRIFAGVLSLFIVVGLTACSTVSEYEYNDIKEKYSSAQEAVTSLVSEVSSNEWIISLMNDYNAEASSKIDEYESQYASASSRISELETLDSGWQNLSDEEKSAAIEYISDAEEKQRLIDEAMGYETGLTFEEISRNPYDYYGDKVKFEGYVLQVMSNLYIEDVLRVATDGKYDDVIYCTYDEKSLDYRLLEDDHIIIYGTVQGITSYETVLGGSVTLPQIAVDRIDLIKDEE
jgi:hypothetical protein